MVSDTSDFDPRMLMKQQSGSAISWKQAWQRVIEKEFEANEQDLPRYVQEAKQNINSLYQQKSFQNKVRQDENEFKIALQQIINQAESEFEQSMAEKEKDVYDNGHRQSNFEYDDSLESSRSFKQLKSGITDVKSVGGLGIDCIDMDMITDVIQEQEEEDFEDMISNNLVLLEYDIYNQIRNQIMKKTNALYQICMEIAKAFIRHYSPYTSVDPKLSKNDQRRVTRQMKSRMQNISMKMRTDDSAQFG